MADEITDEQLEEMEREAWNEAIEAAAKVCDERALKFEAEAKRYYPDTSSYDDYARSAGQARDLAASIRALKKGVVQEQREQTVRRIVERIWADVNDRRGIKQEFRACDDVVQQEIRDEWRKIVEEELTA